MIRGLELLVLPLDLKVGEELDIERLPVESDLIDHAFIMKPAGKHKRKGFRGLSS